MSVEGGKVSQMLGDATDRLYMALTWVARKGILESNCEAHCVYGQAESLDGAELLVGLFRFSSVVDGTTAATADAATTAAATAAASSLSGPDSSASARHSFNSGYCNQDGENSAELHCDEMEVIDIV